MKEEKLPGEIQRLTDPERMIWAAAFVARYIRINGEHLMPADQRRSAVHAAYLQVSSCRSVLGEINVTGWTPSQMLHEMFMESERSESVLEDDLIDRAIFAKPKDRAFRARREFWKVARSLLASENDLAKAALAMIKILEDPSFEG